MIESKLTIQKHPKSTAMKGMFKIYSTQSYLILLLLWIASPALLAQTVIQGVVRYPDGVAAMGVEVILPGTSVHTATDTLGIYEIRSDAPGPFVVEVRHMTYKTVTRVFPCHTSSTWDILLEESPIIVSSTKFNDSGIAKTNRGLNP